MKLLHEIMATNRNFVEHYAHHYPKLNKSPRKRVAIFTCMDTRLVEYLEPGLGLKRGDAVIIKNAGNTIIASGGGVIRSLVVAVYLLGVEEILVIGHRECGMAAIDVQFLTSRMLARGISIDVLNEQVPDLGAWLGTFATPELNVFTTVNMIKKNPLLPKDIPVHGLVFCPNDGKLEVLVEGYED